MTVGGFWDERDKFSGRVNLRARFALPALKHRTRLVLGRGDTDDFIDGTEEQIAEGLPGSFDPDRDDDWLIGLGYSRSGNLSRGFDLGVGVKVASPLEPYVRLTYRCDHGIVATTSDNAPALTRKLLHTLAAERPDVIVFELGDGLLGAYGVEAILHDAEIRNALDAVVLCANDPVGAWGGVKLLRESFEIEPTVVTGPATDNQVGLEIIERRSKVQAVNALTHGADLGDLIQNVLGVASRHAETSS